MRKLTLLLSLNLAFFTSAVQGQSSIADSVLVSTQQMPDSTAVRILMESSMQYLYTEPHISIALLTNAENLCIKQKDSLNLGACLTLHAFCFPDSMAMKSLEYYEQAIPLLIRSGHKYQLQALANAADILVLLGDYESAIDYQQKALDYAMEFARPFHQIAIISNLGYFYDRFRNFDKAISLQEQALEMATAHQDTFMIGLALLRMAGHIEDGLDDHELARTYFDRSLAAYESLADSAQIAQVLSARGNNLLVLGEIKLAEDDIRKAIRLNLRLDRQYDYTQNLINLGKALYVKKDYNGAIKQLMVALDWAQKVRERNFEMDIFEVLYMAYEGLGDYENANRYLLRSKVLSDSIFNAERAQQVSKLEVRYETAEKERQIATLANEKTESELKVAEQQSMIFGMIGGIIILALSGGFILYHHRQRERAKLSQKEIEYQESLITATVNSQEEERKRIAKELHDGIAQTLVASKMQFQALERSGLALNDEQQGRMKQSIDFLDDACQEIRTISHQMMPRVLMDGGLISALEDLLDKSLTFSEISYTFNHEGLNDQSLNQRTEVALYRICQELVNNIIKHSKAKKVSVELIKSKTHITLIVEDDGQGFSSSNSGGIGIANINSRASAIHGKIRFEKGAEQGTVALVTVPIKTADALADKIMTK